MNNFNQLEVFSPFKIRNFEQKFLFFFVHLFLLMLFQEFELEY